MQTGLLSLGHCFAAPQSGSHATSTPRHQAIVEQAVLAEAVGFDAVWIGEHLPGAEAVGSPSVLLAAIAARTERVRVGAAVTLASLDPVRVAEDYATIDAIADGRVELVAAGEELGLERHRESVALLRRLWSETDVTWSGRFRAPLDRVTVEPRPVQRPHPPLWVDAAGGVDAADLAAALGLPLMLPSALFRLDPAPLVARYRERFAAAGHDPALARVGCCQPVHVRREAQEARLLAEVAICGSPGEVVDRIGAARELLGLDLHLARFDLGGLPPPELARTLELYAAEVLPHLVN
jgi:alkanesulfonate monooxygenase SsuD/methylene tetrahydromethanopterin reductase-like flavin-dependent oxidoreductase (luciferase family)